MPWMDTETLITRSHDKQSDGDTKSVGQMLEDKQTMKNYNTVSSKLISEFKGKLITHDTLSALLGTTQEAAVYKNAIAPINKKLESVGHKLSIERGVGYWVRPLDTNKPNTLDVKAKTPKVAKPAAPKVKAIEVAVSPAGICLGEIQTTTDLVLPEYLQVFSDFIKQAGSDPVKLMDFNAAMECLNIPFALRIKEIELVAVHKSPRRLTDETDNATNTCV